MENNEYLKQILRGVTQLRCKDMPLFFYKTKDLFSRVGDLVYSPVEYDEKYCQQIRNYLSKYADASGTPKREESGDGQYFILDLIREGNQGYKKLKHVLGNQGIGSTLGLKREENISKLKGNDLLIIKIKFPNNSSPVFVLKKISESNSVTRQLRREGMFFLTPKNKIKSIEEHTLLLPSFFDMIVFEDKIYTYRPKIVDDIFRRSDQLEQMIRSEMLNAPDTGFQLFEQESREIFFRELINRTQKNKKMKKPVTDFVTACVLHKDSTALEKSRDQITEAFEKNPDMFPKGTHLTNSGLRIRREAKIDKDLIQLLLYFVKGNVGRDYKDDNVYIGSKTGFDRLW